MDGDSTSFVPFDDAKVQLFSQTAMDSCIFLQKIPTSFDVNQVIVREHTRFCHYYGSSATWKKPLRYLAFHAFIRNFAP